MLSPRDIMAASMAEKTLYLIDGNSLLYRSYYALQRLSTSRGSRRTPSTASSRRSGSSRSEASRPTWGSSSTPRAGNSGMTSYEDYKAHRKPMPEDLVVQIPKLKEVTRRPPDPGLRLRSYEADDVLGSLARRAAAKNSTTVIVTTDKDLLQLVDDIAFVYNPAKDILLDEAKVKDDLRRPAGPGHRRPRPLGRPFGQYSRAFRGSARRRPKA